MLKKKYVVLTLLMLLAACVPTVGNIGTQIFSQVRAAGDSDEFYVDEDPISDLEIDDVEGNDVVMSLEEIPKVSTFTEDIGGEDAGRIDVSGYENSEKIAQEAGLKVINIENSDAITNEKTTYELTNDGELIESASEFMDTNLKMNGLDDNQGGQSETAGTKVSSAGDMIKVQDGRIIEAEDGIISTLGGYEATKMMYKSVDDAASKTLGTTISGGGFEGTYLGTEISDGKVFFHMIISGYEGYISADDAQIIPSPLIVSQSYYENVDGVWTFKEAVSPLTSTEYKVLPIDDAPEWSREGVKYFSDDGINFEKDNLLRSGSGESRESYSYFQSLPFRSTSNYTGAQYKSFLTKMGKSASQYYNYTNAFVEGQDKEQVNSLLLFAMANHEGAYGTSNLSKLCNNFFGRSAYDSDPSQACKKHDFKSNGATPRDGILSQTLFLQQNYADVDWWGSHGTELGNKSHGMNVVYASDPNWGIGISSNMYSIDNYLGSKENNYYRIYEVTSSQTLYSNNALSAPLKKKPQGSSEQNYKLPRNDSKNFMVVVTDETSSAFKMQIPMAKHSQASGYVQWSDANKGKYPDYDGKFGGSNNYPNYVNQHSASFAAKYSGWSYQTGWYPKKTGSSNTYKIVSNVTAKAPGVGKNGIDIEEEVCNTGKLNVRKEKTYSNGSLIDSKIWTYDCDTGKQVQYHRETYSSTNGKMSYYRHIAYRKTDGKKTYDKTKQYSGTTISTETVYEYDFNTLKEIDFQYLQYKDGKLAYNKRYIHDKNGILSEFSEKKYSGGKLVDTITSTYSTATKVEEKYHREMYDAKSGKMHYYRHIAFRKTDGKKTYDKKKEYSGTVIKNETIYEYDFNTLKEINFEYSRFNNKGSKEYYKRYVHDKNGKLISKTENFY